MLSGFPGRDAPLGRPDLAARGPYLFGGFAAHSFCVYACVVIEITSDTGDSPPLFTAVTTMSTVEFAGRFSIVKSRSAGEPTVT